MEIVKIIVNEKGELDSVLSEGEVNLEVLKRGRDDAKIDEYEAILESVDF